MFNHDANSESMSGSKGCQCKTAFSVGPTSAQGTGSKLGEDLLRGVVCRMLGEMSDHEGQGVQQTAWSGQLVVIWSVAETLSQLATHAMGYTLDHW